ncbi:B12-binding domain-containing radical SAM protein [Geovibrio ferrireducens]|uniref:B12-binding domain-containing radical SAM protein n=1 Tax=Geovibrio ferrireducens TaxID=46201 RepID=UPI002245D926|nr:radical SAM protein [Geovibrio ferrireducens]
MNQLDPIVSTNTIPIQQGYIASYLKKNKHDSVILDDVKDVPLTLDKLNRYMQEFQPGLVGFCGYHYLMERIRFFAGFIKMFYPETKIILGGPQALFMPEEGLVDLQDFDIICNRGEGEITTLEIVEALCNGDSLKNVPGISFKDSDKYFTTQVPKCMPDNLDIYPSPYISGIIDLSMKKTASVFTSRGCEHMCNFCVTPFFNSQKIRFHSIEHVLEEMEYLESAGMESLWIGDPNFTAYRNRTAELMEQKINKGIRIPFWCQTRVDMVDKKLLRLMKEAGLHCIGFGLESGSDNVLDNMNKGVFVNRFHEMVSYAQSIGLRVELFSMYGQPGETYEDARKTITVVQKYNIPIYANSCAQQLQLTYGSIYGKNPEKFKFRLSSKYLPRYLSYWHEYETCSMTTQDIKGTQAVWALYNAETEYNIKNNINIFHTIDFLITNREMLKKEQRFYEYLLYLASLLEDKEIMMECIEGFRRHISNDKARISQLLKQAEIYTESDRIQENSRAIVFCQYEGGDVSEKHILKPGLNDLRSRFPKFVLKGMKVQESKRVRLDDGTNVSLIVTVIRIFDRVKVKNINQLYGKYSQHNYSYLTFQLLERSSNELLLFLALKSTSYSRLSEMPHIFLNLVSYYSKMHKFTEIERCFQAMLSYTHDPHRTAEAFGDIIAFAGKYKEAADYYHKSDSSEQTLIKLAYTYAKSGNFEKAYELIVDMNKDDDIFYNEVMLECLQNLFPEKQNVIRNLNHKIMHMKVLKIAKDSNLTAQSAKGAVL